MALYILVVFVFDLELAHADNMFFSSVLHRWQGNSTEHMIYVSYMLSYPLAFFSALVPSIDFFTIYIHLCNLAAVMCLACGIARTNEKPGFSHYLGWLLIAIFICKCSLIGAYSIVSFAAMSGGLVLIGKNVRKIRGESVWLLIFAVSVFYMGCILRYDSCVGALPFLVLLAWFSYRKKRFFSLIACAVCSAFVAVCYLIQSPLSSVDYGDRHVENLMKMNASRMKFCDYHDDSGIDKKAQYQAAGCTSKEVSLYCDFCFQQDKCLDEKYWAVLGEIRDSGRKGFSFTRACNMLCYNKDAQNLFFSSCLIFLLLLLWRTSWRPQEGDYVILCALFCYFLLLMRGRLNTVSSLAIMQPCLALWCVVMPGECRFRFIRWMMSLLIIVGGLGALKGLPRYRASLPMFGCRWANPELTSKVVEECHRHVEYTYFAEAHFWRHIALPYSSIHSTNLKRCPNFYPYDSWQVFFPSYQASLRSRGLESPSDLLMSDKVRFILRANSISELENMSGADYLLTRLKKNFDCVQESNNIRLKLVAEKKLCDNLYVVRVEKDPS